VIRLERDGEIFEIRDRIPLLPLRDVVIFPYMTIPLLVGRIPSVNAIEAAVQKASPLQFRLWWPGAPTSVGVYDLPVPETEVVVPQAVLMPPIGFDGECYRLGYGGGFFDRTLAAMSPQPLKIGVAYEELRIETIRPQPHDIAMDCVVTESGIRRRASPPPQAAPARARPIRRP